MSWESKNINKKTTMSCNRLRWAFTCTSIESIDTAAFVGTIRYAAWGEYDGRVHGYAVAASRVSPNTVRALIFGSIWTVCPLRHDKALLRLQALCDGRVNYYPDRETCVAGTPSRASRDMRVLPTPPADFWTRPRTLIPGMALMLQIATETSEVNKKINPPN